MPASRSLAIVCFTLIPFAPALLSSNFVFDDRAAIADNPDVANPDASVSSVFSHDFWGANLTDPHSHKSYRPLSVLLLKLGYSLSPTPLPFRVFNLFLHGINTYLVLLLSKRLLDRRPNWLSLLTALIFGLHPLHTEPVAACVGVADLASASLVLSNILAYMTVRRVAAKVALASICTALAVLFKENGIMLAPTALLLDLVHNRGLLVTGKKKRFLKLPWLEIAALGAAATLILYARLWAMDFHPPKFQEQDNPAAFLQSRHLRMLNRAYQYCLNLWLCLAPDWLCFDWAMGCIPLIVNPMSDPRTLAVLTWTGLSVAFASKWRDKVVCSALVLATLPFLPSSNVFFDVGFVIAERNLYLSVLGPGLLFAEGLNRMTDFVSNKRLRKLLLVSSSCLLLSYAAKSCLRSFHWRTELELYSSGLSVCPLNAKVYYNLAKTSAAAGDAPSAVSLYRRAITLFPDYEHALNNLGEITFVGPELNRIHFAPK